MVSVVQAGDKMVPGVFEGLGNYFLKEGMNIIVTFRSHTETGNRM